MKNTSDIKAISVRLPAELRTWLAEQAAQNHRSINGEIVVRLEEQRKQGQQFLLTSVNSAQ